MMIKELKFFLKVQFKKIKYYRLLPNKQKNSDIYLVEFPKSGITWLSTIIANINLIESNSKQQATYYNIQQLIPDIHMNKNILDEPIWDVPKCRFIKSHSMWCPYYNHVIYLVRNPVSIMNSYYRYASTLNQFQGTFEEFVKDRKFGLDNWKNHVRSWLFRGDSSQRIHLIKYEDLIKNPDEAMNKLYSNLGLKIHKNTINEAIELSDFDKMKASEEFYKKHNPNTSLDFVREGKAQAIVDSSVESYILENTVEIRKLIGY